MQPTDTISGSDSSRHRMADFSDTSGPEDPWLTVQQVSNELKVHPATVRAWIREGRLQAVRAGKGFRVRRSEVDRALGAQAPATRAEEPLNPRSDIEPIAFPRPAPRQIADHIIAVPPMAGKES
jgi:excisionase family DNA binding protein